MRCVNKPIYERLSIRIAWAMRSLQRHTSFWMRILLCWSIGLLFLLTDEKSHFDQRFQIRGLQKADESIVLINIPPSMIATINKDQRFFNFMDQTSELSDEIYWNTEIWQKFLTQLISAEPQKIGVTLYFGDQIDYKPIRYEKSNIFLNEKIYWATAINNMDRELLPVMTNLEQNNIGSIEFRKDEDGMIRRIFSNPLSSHLIEQLANTHFNEKTVGNIINFRGLHAYRSYNMSEILFDEVPKEKLHNKIIIIGVDSSRGLFSTPIGPMNRHELIAHATDNLINKAWIHRLHISVYAFYLLFIILISVFLVTTYPQSVATFFIFWIGLSIAAISAWVFDSFYIWLPVYSSFVTILTTWIVFTNYQISIVEKRNLDLQQEQKYNRELEQLKNNFVSLISHDLKTPIAKIQANIDRMLSQNMTPELSDDLKKIRQYSDELNRYIQSILKVSRIESKEFKLNIEIADMNEMIDEALHFLRPLALEKNIAIVTELQPLYTSEFDTTLIKEVIINLIENAIKYTQVGGQITVKSSEDDTQVYVEVKDNGEGIRPEDMEKIWGKFTRGSDQDHKSKGTGMGLYLVKYFIELHGGKIYLQSQHGIGTTVKFALPIEQSTGDNND